MKNLLKVAFVAFSMLFAGNFAKAQTKIGYINFQALLSQLPEAKTVKSTLDLYQKQFIDQLTVMNTEYQTKGQEYQKGAATMTDAIRTAKQTELQDIQKRMQDYQNITPDRSSRRWQTLRYTLGRKGYQAPKTTGPAADQTPEAGLAILPRPKRGSVVPECKNYSTLHTSQNIAPPAEDSKRIAR